MSKVYYRLSNGRFSQDWSTTATVLTKTTSTSAPFTNTDAWDLVASIVGYLGDGLPIASPGTTVGDNRTVNLIAQSTSTNGSGGVHEIEASQVVALQGSGTADAPNLVFYLDATGRQSITFQATLKELDGTTVDQKFAVQYRIGDTGNFITIPGGSVSGVFNASGNQTANISVTLPPEANGQAELQIRIITTDASGSDAMVGIDDIIIDSLAAAPTAPDVGTFTIDEQFVADEGDSGINSFNFIVTRTGATAGAAVIDFAVTSTQADGGDFVGGALPTGSVTFAPGDTSKTVVIEVQGDEVDEPTEAFTVTISSTTEGATIGGTGQGTGTIRNDDAVIIVPGTLSIADATVAEGNAGSTPITFTVTRADGSDGAVSADYGVTFGNADFGDFTSGQTFSGTVAFANGETSRTITLNIAGDTRPEPTETFAVTLTNPGGGATLGDASATGTITNDDDAVANVFINEFHYDDAGTDAGEAIEVAGTAGTSLAGWTIALYNGGNGTVYATIALSGTLPDQDDGYGTLSFPATGLQNGAPDGFALVNPAGVVVQFLSYEGVVTAIAGPAAGMRSTDVGVSEEGVVDGFSLQLTGTGASYADFTWANAAANTFGAVNTSQDFVAGSATGIVGVADVRVAEGDSGVTNLTFTVRRAGGLDQTASVDYAIVLNGTASSADLFPGAALAGTVSFAAGESAIQVTVPVQGDTIGEDNEVLSLVLSNPVGNIAIGDADATGTILNDDRVTRTIGQIQGAAHISPLLGQPVETTGIVTAIDSNGFYIQDATGDGDAATSDGIFVFTSTAPAGIAVGDSVRVAGTVSEFGSTGRLSVTQITAPTTSVLSQGNALPAAVVIGVGGRLPPTANYEDDNFASFDPATDGLDFYESMEGMRVTIETPLVVANTSDDNFKETFVVASGGAGTTGINARGGITVSAGDFNPERIEIDVDPAIFADADLVYSQGDRLADVTGILNYANAVYEVIVTAPVTRTSDVTLLREDSFITGGLPDQLTVATYNLENLDPLGDDDTSRYELFANDIVFQLNAPDIIGVQEIQDADGAANGTNYSGTVTAGLLIQAILDAGGPEYRYVEVAPTSNNMTGGEPNGNIRNGYLFRIDRVSLVEGSVMLIDDPAFAGSRRPLVAEFLFNGETVTVINAHSTSRINSDDLQGATQPPQNAGDGSRIAQAQAIRDFIDDRAAAPGANAEANTVVVGDFNGFYFEEALGRLQAGGIVNNLYDLLPVNERYSATFEGNLQPLDNILVSPNLLAGALFDAVHINVEQPASAGRPTDHDPLLAGLRITANDTVSGTAGNDIRVSGAGNDLFLLQQGGDDTTRGGTGDDGFIFGATLTAADVVDGEEGGNDQLGIQGDYSGARAVTLTNVVNVEVVVLLSSSNTRFGGGSTTALYDYTITTVDTNVAAGGNLIVDANGLRAGEDLIFNGAAETNGRFFVYAGRGTDSYTLGAGNDVVLFRTGGLTADDRIDGGAGSDEVVLRGDYSGGVTLGANTLANVELIVLLSGRDTRFGKDTGESYSYKLTSDNGNVAGGRTLIVDGGSLRDNESLDFDGSAESDGAFRLFGGAGADVLRGGTGNDSIRGNRGADTLAGGGGNDTFVYFTTQDSTSAGRDGIQDFSIGDRIDLSRIDAILGTPENDAFTFIGDAAFTAAGQLRATQNGSIWTVQGDIDGDGVSDIEFFVVTTDNDPITTSDFIL